MKTPSRVGNNITAIGLFSIAVEVIYRKGFVVPLRNGCTVSDGRKEFLEKIMAHHIRIYIIMKSC